MCISIDARFCAFYAFSNFITENIKLFSENSNCIWENLTCIFQEMNIYEQPNKQFAVKPRLSWPSFYPDRILDIFILLNVHIGNHL